mmetsp:Transcript_5431/g.14316  ORF Transcript_5431/g.14316 Transcript_5431/m.14316 type:complete len:284 (+) Transcript_5431:251-1102(+)
MASPAVAATRSSAPTLDRRSRSTATRSKRRVGYWGIPTHLRAARSSRAPSPSARITSGTSSLRSSPRHSFTRRCATGCGQQRDGSLCATRVARCSAAPSILRAAASSTSRAASSPSLPALSSDRAPAALPLCRTAARTAAAAAGAAGALPRAGVRRQSTFGGSRRRSSCSAPSSSGLAGSPSIRAAWNRSPARARAPARAPPQAREWPPRWRRVPCSRAARAALPSQPSNTGARVAGASPLRVLASSQARSTLIAPRHSRTRWTVALFDRRDGGLMALGGRLC